MSSSPPALSRRPGCRCSGSCATWPRSRRGGSGRFSTGEKAHGFFGEDEDDFEKLDSVPAEEVFAVYAEQCRLADEAAAGLSLDQRFPNPWGNPAAGELDVRWVYLHMIEEYARHNGHADLLRELVDGTTGD